MKTLTISLGDHAYASLLDTLAKINKRADKLGLNPIACNVISKTKADSDLVEYMYLVELSGGFVGVQGWACVARVELTSQGNIITAMPNYFGQDLPKNLRDTTGFCDHCGTKRYRRTIYIFSNDQGGFIQVGKSCLADFIGYGDAATLAGWYDALLLDLQSKKQANREGGGGRRGIWIEGYLAHCAAIIREYGYVSTKKAVAEGKAATKDLAIDNLVKKSNQKNHIKITEQDTARAKKMINFAREHFANPQSDYDHNMHIIFSGDAFELNRAGYVASVYGVWYATQDRKIAQNKSIAQSRHVGNVGDSLQISAEIKFIREFDSQYGTSYLYRLIDNDGNVFVWFASKDQGWAIGDKVAIKGKIKGHDTYNEVKQTLLTRCKEVPAQN